MSKSESITQKWLRQNVQTYPNPDLVYAHADAVLARHPTIRPKTDVYSSVYPPCSPDPSDRSSPRLP